MNYTITIYKRPGVQLHPREPLYALWIDAPMAQSKPGTVWEATEQIDVTTDKPIPAALCGLLLMSESTSDRLFRQIADTWLGPVDDDLLNDYDRYRSWEEAIGSINNAYLDRLEPIRFG